MLDRLYAWYGKRTVIAVASLIALLLVAGIFLYISKSATEEAPAEERLPLVTLRSVNELGGESLFNVTGTVRAVSEAQLQTEASGRITSVNVALGDTVRQGTVLATIENSAQRAALLQAEGAYDAAVAAAASSGVGLESSQSDLDSALTSAINTYQSSYISVDSILHNDIDDLFTISNDNAIGLKIDGQGQATALIAERNALNELVLQWEESKNSATKQNIESRIGSARADLLRISQFVDTLSRLATEQQTSASYTQTQKDALEATLLSARTSLNAELQAIEGASDSIDTAKKAVEQAQIAGSSNAPSASSAQLKSALGSLRAAQANYEKTLVRTPISGVVNVLNLKAGDHTGPSELAAVVANNNALEITAHVNESESDRLSIGQEVLIKGNITGSITNISPAIDALTGKVEIKVQTESTELKNGDTVSITITQSERADETVTDIILPITALKVETDRIVVFTVDENNKLIAHEVVEGPLVGSNIIIKEGVTSDMRIVVDARGLNEGDQVEVAQ